MPKATNENTIDMREFNLLGTLAQAKQFAHATKYKHLNFDDKGMLYYIMDSDKPSQLDRSNNPYFTNFRIYPRQDK